MPDGYLGLRRAGIVLASALCLGLGGEVAAANPPANDGENVKDRRPRIEVAVTVFDDAGDPVADVEVSIWQLRSTHASSSWSDDLHGPQVPSRTGDDGRTTVSVPTMGHNQREVRAAFVYLSHPAYCKTSAEIRIPDAGLETRNATELTINSGTRLTLDVRDSHGESVTSDCFVLLHGQTEYWRECELARDGRLITGALSSAASPLRIAHLPRDGDAEFSEPYHWFAEDTATHHATIAVAPGVEVHGRLDESVPRPVTAGQVIAVVTNPKTDAINPFLWQDVAPIADGGSFRFASLPRGGDLQLIAVCEGHVSTEPLDIQFDILRLRYPGLRNPISPSTHYPQVFTITRRERELVVRMEPTARCRVRFVDRDGLPLEGLRVIASPNQYFLGSGSSTLGTGYRSAQHLRTGKYVPIQTITLEQLSNAEGVIDFDNLPPGQLRTLHIETAARFQTLLSDPLDLAPGETVSITRTLSRPAKNRRSETDQAP
jgi:hypothetical protein